MQMHTLPHPRRNAVGGRAALLSDVNRLELTQRAHMRRIPQRRRQLAQVRGRNLGDVDIPKSLTGQLQRGRPGKVLTAFGYGYETELNQGFQNPMNRCLSKARCVNDRSEEHTSE